MYKDRYNNFRCWLFISRCRPGGASAQGRCAKHSHGFCHILNVLAQTCQAHIRRRIYCCRKVHGPSLEAVQTSFIKAATINGCNRYTKTQKVGGMRQSLSPQQPHIMQVASCTQEAHEPSHETFSSVAILSLGVILRALHTTFLMCCVSNGKITRLLNLTEVLFWLHVIGRCVPRGEA